MATVLPRRQLRSDVLPAWRHRRVRDITRRNIRELVEKKALSAPVVANRLLSRISRLLSFAVKRDWIDANPVLRIRKPTQERSRDRVLSRDELREFWSALAKPMLPVIRGKADACREPRATRSW